MSFLIGPAPHFWSYDLLSERLENGQLVTLLVMLDEFTHECLAIDVNKRLTGDDVVEVLGYLFAVRGVLDFIRSDNGPEFASKAVKKWLKATGVKTLFVAPDSPWENGYVERVIRTIKEEEIWPNLWDSLSEALEAYVTCHNEQHIHSALDYRTPREVAEASITRAAQNCLALGGSLRVKMGNSS